MGWGIIIKNVFVSRVRKNELEMKIGEDDDLLNRLSNRLLVLAAATPRDTKNEEGYVETWEDRIEREVSDAVDQIKEVSYRLFIMRIALENPDDVSDD